MTDRFGSLGWQRTKIVCTLGPATDEPIVASTPSQALCTRLAIVRGVSPVHDEREDARSQLDTAREWLFGRAFARSGDRVVVVSAASAAPAVADALQLKVLHA